MRNFKIFIFGMLAITSMLSSCYKDFDELNTNRIDPTSIEPEFILNRAIMESLPAGSTSGILGYHLGIVQQVITPFGSSLAGANFNIFVPGSAANTWNAIYPNVVKHTIDALEKSKNDDRKSNVYNEARIWKAYAFMILTDDYGEVPYFEAGLGFLQEIFQPVYDSQESIYMDILKELDEATLALDDTKPTSTIDILYAGDILKWKRFGNSLMLRAAMRLIKVSPDVAETYVKKAVVGGLMQSNNDNAKLKHTSLYMNDIANLLTAREKANYYLAEPFVGYLKTNNDPRLRSIAVRHLGATTGNQQFPPRTNSDPSIQIGMPMGYDDVTIKNTFSTYGVASLYDFSQVSLSTVLQLTAPEYFVTFSQTQFLLAEAVIRGWATGDPGALYISGIRGHMEQMAEYNAKIEESEIQTYLVANPLLTATALEQINTQYWVASFLNGWELFANFRRSGYPALTKNPYPGSEITGDFIRRMPYPDRELIVNSGNLNEAISRQGPDNLNTRVWWDKP